MEAIVLVGGLGTRLRSEIDELPKAMAPVNGKPFLDYQLSYLKTNGIERVVLAVGYKKESIQAYFSDEFRNMKLVYAPEEEPLGTGGAIMNALPYVSSSQFFILNGDTIFNIPLETLKSFHKNQQADLTIALRKIEDTARYGGVYADKSGRIKGFFEKGASQGEGMINGGIYFANKELFSHFPSGKKFSFEREVLEKQYRERSFYGIAFENYFLDIGIPEDYKRAQHEFKRLGY